MILRYRMTFGEDGLFQKAATMGRTLDASMNTHAAIPRWTPHAAPLSASDSNPTSEDIVALVGEGAREGMLSEVMVTFPFPVTKGSISAPLFNACGCEGTLSMTAIQSASRPEEECDSHHEKTMCGADPIQFIYDAMDLVWVIIRKV